ncbi:MAG: hypothetical protein WC477_06035 [Patescibacteria group bacterium]
MELNSYNYSDPGYLTAITSQTIGYYKTVKQAANVIHAMECAARAARSYYKSAKQQFC